MNKTIIPEQKMFSILKNVLTKIIFFIHINIFKATIIFLKWVVARSVMNIYIHSVTKTSNEIWADGLEYV